MVGSKLNESLEVKQGFSQGCVMSLFSLMSYLYINGVIREVYGRTNKKGMRLNVGHDRQ